MRRAGSQSTSKEINHESKHQGRSRWKIPPGQREGKGEDRQGDGETPNGERRQGRTRRRKGAREDWAGGESFREVTSLKLESSFVWNNRLSRLGVSSLRRRTLCWELSC